MHANAGSATPDQGWPQADGEDSAGLPTFSFVAESLRAHLLAEADPRKIDRTVVGARFCAVVLDDGCTGAVNICPDACGQPLSEELDYQVRSGIPAAEALAGLGSPTRSAIGLATANALANKSVRDGGRWDEEKLAGDFLDVLELKAGDHVGMVGCFSPMLDRLRSRVGTLSIFERAPRLRPGLLPAEQAVERLPECSVALITSTTIANGTVDALLAACTNCREVVLLGPSTPLVPEIFSGSTQRATLLAGVIVTDSAGLLKTVAQGGGTRDFNAGVIKVNVRVDAKRTAP
jgi:uncharacterized protein (DUF4213/DUF364 family)